MEFDSITLGQVIQLGVTAVALVGAFFTLRAKVVHMEATQKAHKEEMDARFKSAAERDLHLEVGLKEHIQETNLAMRDIASLNTKMDFMIDSLRRLEEKE